MASARDNKMDKAAADLRAADPKARNDAVRALIDMGAAAAPRLRQLVGDPSADIRANAVYALAQIGDVGSGEDFRSALRDADDRVRSHAAVGLARIGHSDAVSACLQTIDDNADPLHTDFTPSVYALGDMGLKAVEPLLGLLASSNADTRMHAQRALELIVAHRHGYRAGKGFPNKTAEAAAQAQWVDNGNYQFSANAPDRTAAMRRWRQWLGTVKE